MLGGSESCGGGETSWGEQVNSGTVTVQKVAVGWRRWERKDPD